MFLLGLTGGIGSGKSTVSKMFHELGAYIIDADAISRSDVASGSKTLKELVTEFGTEILHSNGGLNREKLADIIFAHPSARRKLNAITHPEIARLSVMEIQKALSMGKKIVIYDAALIVENLVYKWLNGLVVVTAPFQSRLLRLCKRDGITKKDAHRRFRSQISDQEKIKVANFVIDNGGDLVYTRKQVVALWHYLLFIT